MAHGSMKPPHSFMFLMTPAKGGNCIGTNISTGRTTGKKGRRRQSSTIVMSQADISQIKKGSNPAEFEIFQIFNTGETIIDGRIEKYEISDN